jgi:hypothetical protein
VADEREQAARIMPRSVRLPRSVPFRIRQTGHRAAAPQADTKSASRHPAPDCATAGTNHDQQAVAFQQVRMLPPGQLSQRSRGKITPNILRGNRR